MISKIIFGEPILPIVIGECAWIRRQDSIMHTSPVVDVNRVSATEFRFETRNSSYILRVVPVPEKEVNQA